MAKIENTTVYPTVTPSADDLLIATDVSDSNKTVTFKVSSIVGAGGVAQDLQSVLTAGHTAIKPIVLTGVNGNIACTDIYPVTVTAQGDTGNAGQILSSTGTGIQWINSPTVTCCGLNDVLTSSAGANIATTAINVNGVALTVQNAGGGVRILNPAILTNSGTSTFTNTVNVNGTSLSFDATGKIDDSNSATGTAGQFLTSEGPGAGVAWSSTLPTAAIPTLQQVLGAGFAAVNAGITFSGTSTIVLGASNGINSSGTNEFNGNNQYTATGNTSSTAAISLGTNATIFAGTGTGTSGQVLARSGTSIKWTTLSLTPNTLQQVLDTGNSATGANANITLSGFIKPGTIKDGAGSVGAAGQVLSSTGSALAWTAAGTGAVASVTGAGAGTSTGAALTIAPTTGSVVVTPNAFNGAANVGHVPSSAAASQTTTFLRADGSWQVPAADAPHGIENFKFYSDNISYNGSTYYTLEKATLTAQPNVFRNSTNPLAAMTYLDEMAGIIFTNPGDGTCASGFNNIAICNGKVQIGANQAGTFRITLWKIELCGGIAATIAGYAAITLGGGGAMGCADITWVSTALRTLEPDYAFYVTFDTGTTTYASGLGFSANVSLRW
tara:strand:- start:60 stop:1892 length:1833 start_codon:yes stop_codon:yes gene_type:complete